MLKIRIVNKTNIVIYLYSNLLKGQVRGAHIQSPFTVTEGRSHRQRVRVDWFMNTAFNLACALQQVSRRADASQRGFTVINQEIHKQDNKNKWMQYNLQPLLHVCLLLNVVETVNLNVNDDMNKTILQCWSFIKWSMCPKQECVCVRACLPACSLLEQRWWYKGPMRRDETRRWVISVHFDKIENQGIRKGVHNDTHTHSHNHQVQPWWLWVCGCSVTLYELKTDQQISRTVPEIRRAKLQVSYITLLRHFHCCVTRTLHK